MECKNRGARIMKMDRSDYRERLKKQLLVKMKVQEDGCWIWQGHKYSNGYGSTRFLGKTGIAHRASYFAFIGDIPDGFDVCHTCDVRDCINPDHLFTATHAVNMNDLKIKGRMPSGESCWRSKPVVLSGVRYGSVAEASRLTGKSKRTCRIKNELEVTNVSSN